MQDKYQSENLQVILLSTDHSKEFYDSKANQLFEKYGGGDWPSVVLPRGWNDAVTFGDFGYGKVIIDDKGIVRSAAEFDLSASLNRVFGH